MTSLNDERFKTFLVIVARMLYTGNAYTIFRRLYPRISPCAYAIIDFLFTQDINKTETKWRHKFAQRILYSRRRFDGAKKELKNMKLITENEQSIVLNPQIRKKIENITSERLNIQINVLRKEKSQYRVGYTEAHAQYDLLVGIREYKRRVKR